MSRGFMYLVEVMDWHSRKVLSWRIINTLDANFCVEAPEEAIGRLAFQKSLTPIKALSFPAVLLQMF